MCKKLIPSNLFFCLKNEIWSGLILCYSLAEHAVVCTLINHLTEAWGQSVAKAAIIVNIVEGSTAVLLLPAAHLSDSYLGYFLEGLILTRFLEYSERESISELCISLVLMTMGRAAEIPLRVLMEDQVREREKKTSQLTSDAIQLQALEEDRSRQQEETDAQEQRIQDRNEIWWYCPWTIGAVGVIFWETRGIQYTLLSTVMAVGLLWFWSGEIFHFYVHNPVRSPLTKVYYVIKAAILKRHYQYPEVADQFLNKENQHVPLLPDRLFLRWLDKSANIDSDTTFSINNVQQHEEEIKQIDVADVKEVKFFLMMATMLSVMLIYGLIQALGSTFFLEQATSTVAHLLWPDRLFKNRRATILLKIGIGMMCSLLCCLSAYAVHVHNMHLEKYMNVFWLTPQFIFLGLMKGLAEGGIDDLLTGPVSESMRIYGKTIVEFVKGVAKFLCILLIYCFRIWFSDDLRQSRLDKYYGLLCICGAGNILLYRFVMQVYVEQPPQTEENISGKSNTRNCLPISISSWRRLQRNSSSLRQRTVKNTNAEETHPGNHPTGQARLNDINEGSSNASPIHEEQSNDVPDDRNVSGHNFGHHIIDTCGDHEQDIEGDYVTESTTSALLTRRSFYRRSSSEKNAREENKNKSLKRSFTA
ncbi:transporter [Lithospermum erythrorhizon]|uniref:Transporter n=1 Tax=Lithospermum erythrorhizon TaxID=34254 RepID=A0AAV3RMQ7_LITER